MLLAIRSESLRDERDNRLNRVELKFVIADDDMEGLSPVIRTVSRASIFGPCGDRAMTVATAALGRDHPLRCVQSSGTTGSARFFLLSHAQLRALVDIFENHLRWTSEDRNAVARVGPNDLYLRMSQKTWGRRIIAGPR